MLPYGDPAELMRTGWVLRRTKSANNRTWMAAAIAYIERVYLGRPDVDV
jgi:hypothetical protein